MPALKNTPKFQNLDFCQLYFNKIYNGKPTVYLDQNILDKIVSYPSLVEDGYFLGYDYQVIYSNETLNEIERSGHSDKFLGVLKELKARRMRFEIDNEFERTGEVIIDPYISPYKIYDDYVNRDQVDKIASKMIENQMAFVFHMFTDKDSQNIAQYTECDNICFEEISEKIIESMKIMRNDIPEDIYILLLRAISDSYQKMTRQLNIYQNHMLKSMTENGIDINSSSGQNGIKRFEETMGISGKILNNIEAPNVLEKIYNLYKVHPDFKDIPICDFYLIPETQGSKELYRFEKVFNIYLMLNMIGYKRDKGFSKKYKRLISAQSDAQHLSYACYCNFVFSEDKSFIDKARAIFDFLNIGTEVVKMNFNISYDNS